MGEGGKGEEERGGCVYAYTLVRDTQYTVYYIRTFLLGTPYWLIPSRSGVLMRKLQCLYALILYLVEVGSRSHTTSRRGRTIL